MRRQRETAENLPVPANPLPFSRVERGKGLELEGMNARKYVTITTTAYPSSPLAPNWERSKESGLYISYRCAGISIRVDFAIASFALIVATQARSPSIESQKTFAPSRILAAQL